MKLFISSHKMVKEIETLASDLLRRSIIYDFVIEQIEIVLSQFICECKSHSNFIDERIKLALQYINDNGSRVIPVKELANVVCLSESRFLHLFKKEVGITYRRAQLWNKVSQSIPELKSQSITKVAYKYGFSDSSHYNKIVNQTFGFSPKEFLHYN